MSDDSSTVIGGAPTEIGDVPGLVLLEVGGVQLCTGALISPHWAITAAHCVDNPLFGLEPTPYVAEMTTIALDRVDLTSDDGIELRGRKIAIDEAFDGQLLNGHDVAFIQLDRAITDREPMPVNFDASQIGPGSQVTFVGFGRTDPADATSIGLAHTLATRTVVACETLGELMPLGDADVLCFDQRDGAGICHGDSGGPVIAMIDGTPTIVGINSFVFDPAQDELTCNEFAASTRTDRHEPLITATIDDVPEESGGCAASDPGSAWLALALVMFVVLRRRTCPSPPRWRTNGCGAGIPHPASSPCGPSTTAAPRCGGARPTAR